MKNVCSFLAQSVLYDNSLLLCLVTVTAIWWFYVI